jgi:hypothetical protein
MKCPACESMNTTRFQWLEHWSFEYWTCWDCDRIFTVKCDRKKVEEILEGGGGDENDCRNYRSLRSSQNRLDKVPSVSLQTALQPLQALCRLPYLLGIL